jgi:hypothetical protein
MIKTDPADDVLRNRPIGGSVPPDNTSPVVPDSAVPPPPPPPSPHSQPYAPLQYTSYTELPYPIQVAAVTGKRKAQRASQVGG